MVRAALLCLTSVLCVLSVQAENLAQSLNDAKTEMAKVEEESRAVMSTLYEINQRMKNMSKKRDNLNNRMLSVESNVTTLAASKFNLETRMAQQRRLLSKRLRAMYMLGDQPLVRTIFSSTSAQDLEKSVKYLRLIAVQDHRLIQSFEKNLANLKTRSRRLEVEIGKLARLKQHMRDQETELEKDQRSKANLLVKLRDSRDKTVQRLHGLRQQASSKKMIDLLDTTFFENKGKLAAPVLGKLIRGYGLVENREFRYRLAHKGHSYHTRMGEPVRAVFDGKIAYVGHVPGYGATIIVDHSDHFYTVYSNNSTAKTTEGSIVKSGDVIAQSGSGLYFEIRHFSDAVDPGQWLTTKERPQ